MFMPPSHDAADQRAARDLAEALREKVESRDSALYVADSTTAQIGHLRKLEDGDLIHHLVSVCASLTDNCKEAYQKLDAVVRKNDEVELHNQANVSSITEERDTLRKEVEKLLRLAQDATGQEERMSNLRKENMVFVFTAMLFDFGRLIPVIDTAGTAGTGVADQGCGNLAPSSCRGRGAQPQK